MTSEEAGDVASGRARTQAPETAPGTGKGRRGARSIASPWPSGETSRSVGARAGSPRSRVGGDLVAKGEGTADKALRHFVVGVVCVRGAEEEWGDKRRVVKWGVRRRWWGRPTGVSRPWKQVAAAPDCVSVGAFVRFFLVSMLVGSSITTP